MIVRFRGIGMTSQRTRNRLVETLRRQGIRRQSVLDAIATVPRHIFVDEALASRAYENSALPIGHGQTISQPYIVARMTEALIGDQTPARVLEVGTGCGYQTAVLAGLVKRLYSIERIEPLVHQARERIHALGLLNVGIVMGDGYQGLPEHAPYDAIIVTAAPPSIPQKLIEQLAEDGRLVMPVGAAGEQRLVEITKSGEQIHERVLDHVVFVPMLTGTQ